MESDPRGGPMALTNEYPRSLREVYPPVSSSVLSVVTMVGKPWTRRMRFKTPYEGLEFLRRMKFRRPTVGVLHYLMSSSYCHDQVYFMSSSQDSSPSHTLPNSKVVIPARLNPKNVSLDRSKEPSQGSTSPPM
jgi:hypothetical protein